LVELGMDFFGMSVYDSDLVHVGNGENGEASKTKRLGWIGI